jgi:hypothetical protein
VSNVAENIYTRYLISQGIFPSDLSLWNKGRNQKALKKKKDIFKDSRFSFKKICVSGICKIGLHKSLFAEGREVCSAYLPF